MRVRFQLLEVDELDRGRMRRFEIDGRATPRRNASFQRVAQRHHLSPGFKPGKPHSGCGVTKSFP